MKPPSNHEEREHAVATNCRTAAQSGGPEYGFDPATISLPDVMMFAITNRDGCDTCSRPGPDGGDR